MLTKLSLNKNSECGCESCRIMALMPAQMEAGTMSQVIAKLFFKYGLRDTMTEIGPIIEDAQDMFEFLTALEMEGQINGKKRTGPVADAGPGVKVMEFSSMEEMLAHIKANEPGVSEPTLAELQRLADEDKAQNEPSKEEMWALASLMFGPQMANAMFRKH